LNSSKFTFNVVGRIRFYNAVVMVKKFKGVGLGNFHWDSDVNWWKIFTFNCGLFGKGICSSIVAVSVCVSVSWDMYEFGRDMEQVVVIFDTEEQIVIRAFEDISRL
jgi:hypothetical protein